MRRLSVFNQVSLDGYFTDANGDMSWAHKDPDDAEWNAFVADNASGGGTLLFGRTTYELMAGFWPQDLLPGSRSFASTLSRSLRAPSALPV